MEDKEGNTALHIAARHGHASVVKTLISYGASVLKSVTLFSAHPLPCEKNFAKVNRRCFLTQLASRSSSATMKGSSALLMCFTQL